MHGFPIKNISLRELIFLKLKQLSIKFLPEIKLHVKSNFFKDSFLSKFSIFSILFNAKLRYSNSFNFDKFSIFSIKLFYSNRIFKCQQ